MFQPTDRALSLSYPGYLEKSMAQRPDLEWDHTSMDTEQPDYKVGWRGAAPVVEVTSLHDPAARLLTLARRDD